MTYSSQNFMPSTVKEGLTSHQAGAVLRLKQLKASIGLSRSTIYAMMDEKSSQYDPNFPRQIKLGKSSVAWRESEVAAWLASRPRSK